MAADQFTEFDYLLNALESAASCEYPAQHGYGEKRKALYRHVRELERKAALWNLIESMWSFPGQTLGELVQRIAKERTAGVEACCSIDQFSSRVCERGTHGCVVAHGVPEVQPQQGETR